MYFGIFSFGGGEIILVLLAVLLLFGANKIPELARMLGKGMNEFRRATDDIKKEFREGADDFKKDIEDGKKDIEHHIHEIGDTLKEEESYKPYQDLDKDKSEDQSLDTQAQPRPKKNYNTENETE